MEINWEKKYNEALERARALREEAIEKEYVNDYVKDYDAIFPELAESEDERIREELIGHCKDLVRMNQDDKVMLSIYEPWLAWLEKQKEQKQYEYKVGDKVRLNWDIVKIEGVYPKEQKPIKRPKFKIGDVVKFKGFGDEPADDTPLKIVGYDNELYLFDNGTTDLFSEQDLYELVEQKPAEKQDYSGLNDLERAIHRGFLSAGVENVPVTIIKEAAQDCLEQVKLAEWNYDNRIQYDSVKSGIEAFASTYSFNIESKLFPQLTKEQKQLWREEIEQAVINGGKYGIEIARDNRYKENRTIEWSKEDGVMLNNIIWNVHMKSIKHLDEMDDRSKYEKYENFLKSLPTRFNLPPKQEWSEEDELMRNAVIQTLETLGGRGTTGMQIDWLKSIKNRGNSPKSNANSTSWKPSEEQMDALEWMLTTVTMKDGGRGVVLKNLVSDLKNLM